MFFFEPDSIYVPIQWLLDIQWRVATRPSKRSRQELVVKYIAQFIPADMYFSESEFSVLLLEHHTFGDPALLRRELYIQHYIDREKDGRRYRKM